jgi:OmpA-OmpF porin, OOP family
MEIHLMKRIHSLVLAAAAALLSACASTPERIDELETARALVPQVEASPRAGVAASYISEARKWLNQANTLFENSDKNIQDIQFAANVATRNAQIANEKILTAQAKEEFERGTAERQAVLLEARDRQAQKLEQELADLKAKKTDRGLVVTLGDVLFDTGKATLKPGAYSTVDRLAQALRESPNRKVVIEGHTDSVGNEEYNLQLSERRAQAVQAALFERGVASNQISTTGKGEMVPVASNDTASGRQENRRVELIFQEGSQVASDVQ